MAITKKSGSAADKAKAATKAAADAAAADAKETDVEETVDETVVDEKAVDEKAVDEKAVDEKTSESKEVVVKKVAPAPAIGGGKIVMALGGFDNALPPLDFGTLPRIKASNGSLKGEDGSVGKEIEVTLVSYNNQFAITPNENNAPPEFCKFSHDGVVLSDGSGTSVEDHIAMLNDEGYEKACAKRYLEVIVILDDTEIECDEIGNMVSLSLSPQSVKQFERYQLQTTVKIKQGNVAEEDAMKMKVTAKEKSFGSNDFTIMQFAML